MTLLDRSEWKQDPVFPLICLGLLLLPVTNALGQVPLYLASVVWAVQALRGRQPVNRRTLGFLAVYAVIILVSLTYAVHVERGVSKLNRLLLFPLAGAAFAACAGTADPLERVRTLLTHLVAGVCLLGLYDLVHFPMSIHGGMDFVDVGNMTSPQFYLVGLVVLLCLHRGRRATLGRWFWFCLPLITAGLLAHQKRGVWLACLATVGLWTLWGRRWKVLAAMVAVACLSLLHPEVRERLRSLEDVIQPTHGGRMILWTQVAPRLLPEHPWGMGFNGSTYEDFREALPSTHHMEVGLNHLHNNFLQIRLELGWHGVAFWTLWMGVALWTAFRPMPPGVRMPRAAVSFALLGLLLNGLVEYNFGDSEVQKLFLVFLGLLDVFPRLEEGFRSSETDEDPGSERRKVA